MGVLEVPGSSFDSQDPTSGLFFPNLVAQFQVSSPEAAEKEAKEKKEKEKKKGKQTDGFAGPMLSSVVKFLPTH